MPHCYVKPGYKHLPGSDLNMHLCISLFKLPLRTHFFNDIYRGTILYLPSIVFCWLNLFLWGKLFCKSIFPLNNLMVQVFRCINPLVIVFIHFSPCNFCWVKSWNCKVKEPWHKEHLSARVPGGVSFSVQLPHSTSTADNIWDKNMLLVNVPQPIIHKSIYLCAHTELK